MATLFLHIGTSKAGSTALQDFLSLNKTPLAGHGLRYGPGFATANHLELAAAFCTRTTRVTGDLGIHDDEDRRRLQQRLERRLEGVDDDARWLLSTEHLGTLLSRDEDLAALASFLRRWFDRIVVVVVLRRIGSWLPSAYVESVRGGSTKLLDAAYVDQRRRLLDQRRLLRHWQDSFRPDQVAAVPFLESDKADPDALSFRFLEVVGVSDPHEVEWTEPPLLSNTGMSAYATEVLRLANPRLRRHALRPVQARRKAIDFVTDTWPGRSVELTPEAARQLQLLELDDVTLARSRYAVGDCWEAWAAEPKPPIEPQTVLTEAEQAWAFDALLAAGLLDPAGGSGPSGPLSRLAVPVRKAWQRIGRPRLRP